MSTAATVIIAAADQSAAQADLPGHFIIGYYEDIPDADPTVATHYVDSGWWYDSELDLIVNDVTWPRRVYFGDVQQVLASLNLKPVRDLAEPV